MKNKIVVIVLLISMESYSQSAAVCTNTISERRQALNQLYNSMRNYLNQHGEYPDFSSVKNASIDQLIPKELKNYKIAIDKELNAVYYSCDVEASGKKSGHTETMYIDLSDGSGFSSIGTKP